MPELDADLADVSGTPPSSPRAALADRIADLPLAAYRDLAKRLKVDELEVIDAARLDPARRFVRAGAGIIELRNGDGRGP